MSNRLVNHSSTDDIPTQPSTPRLPKPHPQVTSSPTFIFIPTEVDDEPPTEFWPAQPAERQPKTVASLVSSALESILTLPDSAEGRMSKWEEWLIGKNFSRHLQRELESELERTLDHLLDEVIARNVFRLILSPADYAKRQAYLPKLAHKLTQHLESLIEARDYQVLGAVQVEILSDDRLSPGRWRLQSEISEQAAVAPSTPYLELLPGGQRFPLDKPRLSIGRSRQNDICLGELDSRRVVSRHHAEIRREGDGFVLVDGVGGQPSTAGTFVDGHRASTTVGSQLRDGQQFVLRPTQRFDPTRPLEGSLLFVFHAAA